MLEKREKLKSKDSRERLISVPKLLMGGRTLGEEGKKLEKKGSREGDWSTKVRGEKYGCTVGGFGKERAVDRVQSACSLGEGENVKE